MTDKTHTFIDGWIEDNVSATGYEPEGDGTEAKRLAAQCWRECDSAGISRPAVNAAVGDLVAYMADAIERVNNAEVQRLANKD